MNVDTSSASSFAGQHTTDFVIGVFAVVRLFKPHDMQHVPSHTVNVQLKVCCQAVWSKAVQMYYNPGHDHSHKQVLLVTCCLMSCRKC